MSAGTVSEEAGAPSVAGPGGARGVAPAPAPTASGGTPQPTAPLAELCKQLEALTDRLSACLVVALGNQETQEAERCVADLRSVCSSLQGATLLLDAMLAENTAEHRAAFKALIHAFGEKVRDAGDVSQGMVERVSGHMEELDNLGETAPGEALASRLHEVLVSVQQTTTEVGDHIAAVAEDVGRAGEQITHIESVLVDAARKAHHDELTGTDNRLALDLALYSALGDGEPRCPWSLLLIDIDRFRAINDSMGRVVGDALLYKIARLIDKALLTGGHDCTLARYGGEEFAILVRGASISQAGDLAERLRKSVAEAEWAVRGNAEGVLRATVSIGVTKHGTGDTVQAVYDRAEAAVRKAKTDGRNRVAIERTAAGRASALRRAAARGSF